jgi:hypothetical protein
MGHIFSPAADTWIRLFMAGAASLVVGSIVFAVGFARSDWVTGAHIQPPAQPVPFSHKHHNGELGIDCRYCHTSVEESAFANIPPTKTCMNCHSQIWTNAPILEPVRASYRENRPLEWTRVHDLPDFVYFNHSIHVAKGVGCATCHGQVDRMPLMYQENSLQMRWCLDCHRNPAKYVRPRDQVFNMAYERPADDPGLGERLVKEYKIADAKQITSCSTCHR